MSSINKYKKIFDIPRQQLFLIFVTAIMLLIILFGYFNNLKIVISFLPAALAIIVSFMLWQWQISVQKKITLSISILILGYIFCVIGDKYLSGYIYNSIFGYKIAGVSLAISLIWFMISLSAWQIVSLGNLKTTNKYLLGVLVVVTFDILLEQAANTIGLWSWPGNIPSLINYLTWIIGSFLIFIILQKNENSEKIPNLYIASILPMMAVFAWVLML